MIVSADDDEMPVLVKGPKSVKKVVGGTVRIKEQGKAQRDQPQPTLTGCLGRFPTMKTRCLC